MAGAGSIPIQGCAIAITQLAANGTPVAGSTSYVQDDKPLLKWTAKPVMETGVEITPKSACGVPIISYKDFDYYKRWDVTLDLSDFDVDKMLLLGNGTAITAGSSTGRAVADGVVVTNSAVITSAADANFVSTDVGRTITGTGVPANTWISEVLGATGAVMSAAATGSTGPGSYTLGTIGARSMGYSWPQLICTPNTNGVSIEIWMKAIVRCTGYQGTTPYPSAGNTNGATGPNYPSSAWIRMGAFRCFMYHSDQDIEDKEFSNMFTGWAIENPLFGTGPRADWTTSGVSGGPPIDTTKVMAAMYDFQLPSPLQAGFQVAP